MTSHSYDVFFCCLLFRSCLECCTTVCCCANEPNEYTSLNEEVKKDKDKEKNKDAKETDEKIPVHYILCEDEIVNNLSN